MHLCFRATVQALAGLGIDQRVFLAEREHRFEPFFLDTFGHEVVDHALGAAQTEVGVIVDVAHAVGVTEHTELYVGMIDNPLRLTVETCNRLGVERVLVETKIDVKRHLRLKLALKRGNRARLRNAYAARRAGSFRQAGAA